MKGLEGKVAIVTGGATIIGAAVVQALCSYGAKVALFDIDAAGGEKAASAHAGAVRFWPVDIVNDEQLSAGVAEAAAHFGAWIFSSTSPQHISTTARDRAGATGSLRSTSTW